MKTQDLFTFNRSSKRLNESIDKVFGKKINFETFDTVKLEDARNKLRTQIHSARSESGFNETIENEALTQAQWMHDAIVAELMHRQEHIVNSQVEEGYASETEMELHKLAQDPDFDSIYDAMGRSDEVGRVLQDMADDISSETGLHLDDDIEKIIDRIGFRLQDEYGDPDFDEPAEPDDSMDGDHDSAMASAGFGSDEDYGYYGNDEDVQYEDRVDEKSVSKAQQRAMGAALAAKRGDIPMSDLKGASKEMAKMSKSDLRDFAKTKHKGLPEKVKKESVESGEYMTTLREGEVQQASAIVTAKTMVDRVSRWIEELSGMENDTLLQLGDSIRDEMGQEQAKGFISAVAPAIQQALETLKGTRDTLSTGVRSLASGETPTGMLGAEPGAEGGDELGAAEPDMMNAGGDMEAPEEGGEDEFAAAEPAAGGLGDAGREQRESIDRSNSLLKVLAG
jgi:Protein of unknwon function (DUF3008)